MNIDKLHFSLRCLEEALLSCEEQEKSLRTLPQWNQALGALRVLIIATDNDEQKQNKPKVYATGSIGRIE